MKRSRFPLVAALMFAAGLAQAQPFGYAVQGDGDDQLYRINMQTGAATAIGPVGFGDVECLTFAPNGELLGFDDSSDQLIRINLATGAGTVIGAIGQSVTDCGLSFGPGGQLFLSSDSPTNLYVVNPATGAGTLIGDMGQGVTGLAYRGGVLYGLGGDDTDNLVTLNTATGAATPVGSLVNVGLSDGGIDFDTTGVLWGIEDGGTIFTVSPATGLATVVTTTLSGFEGLVISVGATGTAGVPVPTLGGELLAALALLLAAFGWRARRR